MKKILTVLLSLIVSITAFAFVGCGDRTSDGGDVINPIIPDDDPIDTEKPNEGDTTDTEKPDDNGDGNDQTKPDDDTTDPTKPDDGNKTETITPEEEVDKPTISDDGSISKPTMPDDGDMQTVSVENAVEEFDAFYKKLKENGYGSYQAYAYRYQDSYSKVDLYDGKIKYVGATVKSAQLINSAEVYEGINENGTMIAAITASSDIIGKSRSNAKSSNLSHLNRDTHDNSVKTGIQKGPQLYGFIEKDLDDGFDKYKFDRQIGFYQDSPDWNKPHTGEIPCSYAMNYGADYDRLAIDEVGTRLNMVKNYSEDGQVNYLALPDLVDAAEYSCEVKNFSFSAKKIETKFFASVKYTMEYTGISSDKNMTVNHEYAILFDLNSPSSVKSLPSNGIDIEGLSLNKMSDRIIYPDVTSEQLAQAVEEGKDLTVNIVGGGDLDNLILTDYRGKNLKITDGKVTVKGAEIKAAMDENRKDFEDFGLLGIDPPTSLSIIKFNYKYTDSVGHFIGSISIAY